MAAEMMRPQQRAGNAVAQPMAASASLLGMRQTKLVAGAAISSPAMEQLKRTAGAQHAQHALSCS